MGSEKWETKKFMIIFRMWNPHTSNCNTHTFSIFSNHFHIKTKFKLLKIKSECVDYNLRCVDYILREGNAVADKITSFGLTPTSLIWYDLPPTELLSFLHMDAMGNPYYRAS